MLAGAASQWLRLGVNESLEVSMGDGEMILFLPYELSPLSSCVVKLDLSQAEPVAGSLLPPSPPEWSWEWSVCVGIAQAVQVFVSWALFAGPGFLHAACWKQLEIWGWKGEKREAGICHEAAPPEQPRVEKM